MVATVRKTRDMSAPQKVGKHHRLLCLTGENKGVSYYITGKRSVMGRGEESDIVIYDQKASREHIELIMKGDEFLLTDLDSQNGVIVNDLKVTQYKLKDNDKIIIGHTIYKYNFFNIEYAMESQEADEGEVEGDEIPEIEKKVTKKDEGKRKKIILIIAVALIAMFLFDDDPEVKNKKKKAIDIDKVDNLTKALERKQEKEDREQVKKINAIIHRGQREFREGNYFRAIEEFDLALLLSPNHGQASFYKRKSQQRIDEEIEQSFLKGRQQMDSLKFEKAMKTYCSIIKLLNNYSDDQRYKDANSNLKIVENKMGMLEGDLNCE